MGQYQCRFSVDGRIVEQIIGAVTEYDARKLVEAQYSNSKIIWYWAKRIG